MDCAHTKKANNSKTNSHEEQPIANTTPPSPPLQPALQTALSKDSHTIELHNYLVIPSSYETQNSVRPSHKTKKQTNKQTKKHRSTPYKIKPKNNLSSPASNEKDEIAKQDEMEVIDERQEEMNEKRKSEETEETEQKCKFPNCIKNALKKDGVVQLYCSRAHAQQDIDLIYPPVEQDIHFYDKNMPYFEFTNFYEAPVVIDGKKWRTTEHYFQAMKFQGTKKEEEVRKLKKARDAFAFSRKNQKAVRADWHSIKEQFMHTAVLAKFTQHKTLREMLCATGKSQLVEHTEKDSFWGDGGDGKGENKLGKILMKVREQLCTYGGTNQQGTVGCTNLKLEICQKERMAEGES